MLRYAYAAREAKAEEDAVGAGPDGLFSFYDARRFAVEQLLADAI